MNDRRTETKRRKCRNEEKESVTSESEMNRESVRYWRRRRMMVSWRKERDS